MKRNRINSRNIIIIYAILILMNFVGSINDRNESKSNNANSEKTFVNNRKRKLEDENYIIVKYNEDVEYPNGFQNEDRTNVKYIKYNDHDYGIQEALSISANTEVKIYILPEATSLEKLFYSFVDSKVEKIISVDFSNFDSSLITSLDALFFGCSSLQNINFSNFITSKVTRMVDTFYGCIKLQSLDLSNFDTSEVTFMAGTFRGCQQLQSLRISSFDTSKVVDMGNMFCECTQLQSLDLSNFNTPLLLVII